MKNKKMKKLLLGGLIAGATLSFSGCTNDIVLMYGVASPIEESSTIKFDPNMNHPYEDYGVIQPYDFSPSDNVPFEAYGVISNDDII